MDTDGGSRRHGWRATARRDDGGCINARNRMPVRSYRQASRHRLPGLPRRNARRGDRCHRPVGCRQETGFRRTTRQCRGNPSRDFQAWHQAGRAHRPDFGTRSGERLPADRLDRRGMVRKTREQSRRSGNSRNEIDISARQSDARVQCRRCADIRLRQQHTPGRVR